MSESARRRRIAHGGEERETGAWVCIRDVDVSAELPTERAYHGESQPIAGGEIEAFWQAWAMVANGEREAVR